MGLSFPIPRFLPWNTARVLPCPGPLGDQGFSPDLRKPCSATVRPACITERRLRVLGMPRKDVAASSPRPFSSLDRRPVGAVTARLPSRGRPRPSEIPRITATVCTSGSPPARQHASAGAVGDITRGGGLLALAHRLDLGALEPWSRRSQRPGLHDGPGGVTKSDTDGRFREIESTRSPWMITHSGAATATSSPRRRRSSDHPSKP